MDLANEALLFNTTALPHEANFRETPQNLHPELAGLTRDLYLRRDNSKPASYVDVFVDDFLGLTQGPSHRQLQVRRTLFRDLDKVFQPRDHGKLTNHKEVLFLNKPLEGECIW